MAFFNIFPDATDIAGPITTLENNCSGGGGGIIYMILLWQMTPPLWQKVKRN